MPHARRWRPTTLLRSPTLQCHPERGCRAVYAKRFLFLRTESAGVSRRKCCSNRPPAYDIGLLVLRHLIHYRGGAEGCRRQFKRGILHEAKLHKRTQFIAANTRVSCFGHRNTKPLEASSNAARRSVSTESECQSAGTHPLWRLGTSQTKDDPLAALPSNYQTKPNDPANTGTSLKEERIECGFIGPKRIIDIMSIEAGIASRRSFGRTLRMTSKTQSLREGPSATAAS